MRRTETHFQQIRLAKVKEILAHLRESQETVPPVNRRRRHVLRCTICYRPVPLETAKTDCNGQAIHEECFLATLTGKKRRPR